jgi:ferredoxin
MVAEITILLLVLCVCFGKSNSKSYKYIPSISKIRIKQKCFAVPEWLAQGTDPEQSVEIIRVRFINTVSGKDVVVDNVPRGSNLLAIGDNAGVKLPRACRTGLCGSCTCEVKDPLAIATATNPRDGFATIRACSTKCYVPDGLDEMVVDVHRMQRKPAKAPGVVGRDSTTIEDITSVRFIEQIPFYVYLL